MEIIINKTKELVNAFFIGNEGAICVPYEGDFLAEYKPTEFTFPNLSEAIQKAKNNLLHNSADRQLERLKKYCKANDIKIED